MRLFRLLAILLAATLPALASTEKLTAEKRAELVRNLTAEYGNAKILIPRSKKPLEINEKGQYDREEWTLAMSKFGPAARLDDVVQITKIEFKGKRLVIQLNHGLGGGRKWWHRVQVSGNSQGTTLGANQATHAPGGTTLAVVFEEGIPAKDADEFKAMLKPVLDFEHRSATEHYLDRIDPKFKTAIEENEVIEGMDHEMVRLSQGKPIRKVRDFKDGIETEDWIYGEPPGDIIFVTFEDGEVIRIKETYAALGGQTKKLPPIER